VTPDVFEVIDWPAIFGVKATPLKAALAETSGTRHTRRSRWSSRARYFLRIVISPSYGGLSFRNGSTFGQPHEPVSYRAGAMGWRGLPCLKRGHQVTVLEAAPEAGGMAAHFDLGGLSIERYYHFVCKADRSTFDLLAELGLGDKMRWVPTSMGYYIDGRLYPWGDPLSLLTFPKLSLIEKLRYGAMMFFSTRRSDWQSLENVSAKDWITRWCGSAVYERLWAPLFRLKFFEYAENISAAWIWTRIKRVGTSRRSLFQEELGYIEGGSETLVHALTRAIAEEAGPCVSTRR
jgi:protoporphyrinogen oxidase